MLRSCLVPACSFDELCRADKGHTCERSRNPTGNLTGADSSTARDADFWDMEDVFWYAPAVVHNCNDPSLIPLLTHDCILLTMNLHLCLQGSQLVHHALRCSSYCPPRLVHTHHPA